MPEPVDVLLNEYRTTSDQIFHNVSQTTGFINLTVLALAAGAGLLVTKPIGFTFVPFILYAWIFRVASLDHETSKLKAYKASLERRIGKRLRDPSLLVFEKTVGYRDRPSLPTILVAGSTHVPGLVVKVASIWIVGDTFGTVAGTSYAIVFVLFEGILAWVVADRERQRVQWDHELGLGAAPDSVIYGTRRIRLTAAWIAFVGLVFAAPLVVRTLKRTPIAPQQALSIIHPNVSQVLGDASAIIDSRWVEISVPQAQLDRTRDLPPDVRNSLDLSINVETSGGAAIMLDKQAVAPNRVLVWRVLLSRNQDLTLAVQFTWQDAGHQREALNYVSVHSP